MPPKRFSPTSDSDSSELPLKKTQRTHEENQERAYIAASRRADRDIEHRIRSALKASECRRKRTGRGLKITRKAVIGDEQYESEDDDRSLRRLSMPAATSVAYTTSNADRYAEIDALFAKHFPNFQTSSRWPAVSAMSTTTTAAAATATTTAATGAQIHRNSYPQPLQLQTGYVPAFPQPNKRGSIVSQASPLTPPGSYPLPPSRDESPNCMSPLALSIDGSRPTSASPTPARQARPTGLVMPDPYQVEGGAGMEICVAGAMDGETGGDDDGHLPQLDFSSTTTASDSGDGDVHDAAGNTTDASAWRNRSYSLPSSLAQFHFPYEPSSSNAKQDLFSDLEADSALIDPNILGGGSGDMDMGMGMNMDMNMDMGFGMPGMNLPMVSGPGGMGAATTTSGDGTTTNGPGEPWADWVDLDGDGPAVLGVEV
ncbi:uncharacterized protein C8A04DRAFT_29297 [Dichotomopilus funicola]|uniref:Uncharacterized protein n=1 Tax=Dichotomopilus funicola TaxID=1934379 RepID=A0AAN6V1L1_9PEZI|nr:hypothetical protein C8A04DRAFT_29297 [Dichotomopilus funicola]